METLNLNYMGPLWAVWFMLLVLVLALSVAWAVKLLRPKKARPANLFYQDKDLIVALPLVQNVELLHKKVKGGATIKRGIWIITKHTKYNFDQDIWENPVYIPQKQAQGFIDVWAQYIKDTKGR